MDSNLYLGIEEIDAQHKSLFDCVDRLEQAIREGRGWAEGHFALVQFEQYAQNHFMVEEAVLRLNANPRLDLHIAEHRELIHKVRHFKLITLKGDHSRETADYLRQWLNKHIVELDSDFLDYLRTAPVAIAHPAA